MPSIPAHLDPWAIRAQELKNRPTPSADQLEEMSTQEYNNFVIAGYDCKAEVIRQKKKHDAWVAERNKISKEEREAVWEKARNKADEETKRKVAERERLREVQLIIDEQMKVLRA